MLQWARIAIVNPSASSCLELIKYFVLWLVLAFISRIALTLPMLFKRGQFAFGTRYFYILGNGIYPLFNASLILRNGLTDSMKRRPKINRDAYPYLDELLENSKYYNFEAVNAKYLGKGMQGQAVYYAAARINGEIYSIKFKLDIWNKSDNYLHIKIIM